MCLLCVHALFKNEKAIGKASLSYHLELYHVSSVRATNAMKLEAIKEDKDFQLRKLEETWHHQIAILKILNMFFIFTIITCFVIPEQCLLWIWTLIIIIQFYILK